MATTIDEAMALLTSWMNNKVKIVLDVDPNPSGGETEALCTITSVDGVHFTYSITVTTTTTGGYGLGDATQLIVRPGMMQFDHNGTIVSFTDFQP
jgi:hypothetical protein